MARSFNGTTDRAVSNTPVGIVLSQLTLSMWVYITAYKNPAFGTVFAYDTTTTAAQKGGFAIWASTAVAGQAWIAIQNATGALTWGDSFAQPSAGAWHHWLYVVDRTVPVQKMWIDGTAQALGIVGHAAGAYGGFGANGQFYTGAEGAASQNPQGMRICEAAGYNAQWGQREATALASGASVMDMPQDGLAFYVPFGGYDSPEPRWNGPHPVPPPGNVPIAWGLTGTSAAANPPVARATVGRRLAF